MIDDLNIILAKNIYQDLYDDTHWRELDEFKNYLSTGSYNNRDEKVLNQIIEDCEYETVCIKDLICCQPFLYTEVIEDIDKPVDTSILGIRPYNSFKVFIHEGHHRIARLIINKQTHVNMKIYEIKSSNFFKQLQTNKNNNMLKCFFGLHHYEVYKELPKLNNTNGEVGKIIICRCKDCGKIKTTTIYNVD